MQNNQKQNTTIPSISGIPWLGQTVQAATAALPFLIKLNRSHPEIVRIKFAGRHLHVIQNPEIARHVLVANARNYFKPGFAEDFKRFLGDGLASSNGDLWLRQRRLLAPIFNKGRIERYFDVINDETNELINHWKTAKIDTEINISKGFQALTMNNIAKSMFGANISGQINQIIATVDTLLVYATYRATSVVKFPQWLPTRENRQFQNASSQFEKLVLALIEQRQSERKGDIDSKREDLLEMLMSAVDEETNENMNLKQLRDEIATIFMAGHETTAQTLGWVFYELARNPELQESLREEIMNIGKGHLDMSSIMNMKLTKRFINEVLRLYPPVWLIARKASNSDSLPGGYDLKSGSVVLVNVYGMHRNPEFWNKPDALNPDRFLPESNEPYKNDSYIPFGAGPRVCIGNHFALFILQTVIVKLLQEFRFSRCDENTPAIIPGVTLRAKKDIFLNVTKV